jgi:elongation factor 1-gamma
MSQLRIFSYLPNPRIWKAAIAARLCGVDIEVRGASPPELGFWRWDFEARPLSENEQRESQEAVVGTTGFRGVRLHKTAAFMRTHPFGTVPAAFSPDGTVGIFESNSIMRAVARLGERRRRLYGRDAYEASRVDSFLDASLVFARDAQHYLLALMSGAGAAELHTRTRDAFVVYAAGIDQALAPDREFLVGDDITLADICFVAEWALFLNERAGSVAVGLEPIVGPERSAEFPRAFAHFSRCAAHPAFAPDVEPYLMKLHRSAS